MSTIAAPVTTDPGPLDPGAGAGRRGALLIAAVILALAVALASGLLAGSQLAPGVGGTPVDASVDAGFARDMQAHHNQAVEMSTLVLDRSQDPEVRVLARDILLTQQQQAGQMHGWLELWGLPQASTLPVMAWASSDDAAEADGMAGMDHGAGGGAGGGAGAMAMPGMATTEDLAALARSTGVEVDRRYLQLMIPHHEGGAAMAAVAAQEADEPVVRGLAGSVVESQTAELTVLREMLAARGGPVDG